MTPLRAKVLSYTGGNKCGLALRALFKATLTREEGNSLDEDVEVAYVHDLFTQYKTLADPCRFGKTDIFGQPEQPLTIDKQDDPTEVLRLTGLLDLGAAGAFQVPARGVRVACMWPVAGSWRCCG